MSAPEPFPILNTSADQLHTSMVDNGPRRRRKSSALGGEVRAGDTGAPALASSRASMNASDGHGQGLPSKRLSKRRRARGLLSRVRHTMVKHTYVLPACILLVFLSLYALNPSETNPIHRFIFLSYPLPSTAPGAPVLYGKGVWDIALVVFYTVVLTFTREFIMQVILKPAARRAGLSRSKQARFMEQMYTALYFGIVGPVGMYIMNRTPVWYFNTRGMYEGTPHWYHEAVFKFYYLFQAAYWAQQAIVLLLGMEKPRKDFKELVAHHVVSLSLIGLSYRFHFTAIGLAVYVTHDISDFFLATSKTLNYLDSAITGPYFALFMSVWIYMRHYLNLKIIYSLFTEYKTIGPYKLDWAGEQFKSPLSFYITLSLLSCLQALNIFWLFYIARIAYRFVFFKQLDDDRSEDEEMDPIPAPLEKRLNGHSAANGIAVGNGVKG